MHPHQSGCNLIWGGFSERNRSRIAEIVAAPAAIVAAATNRSCPFLKTAKRFSKNEIRIAVCDIAANQVTDIRLSIFKYHGDIFH